MENTQKRHPSLKPESGEPPRCVIFLLTSCRK